MVDGLWHANYSGVLNMTVQEAAIWRAKPPQLKKIAKIIWFFLIAEVRKFASPKRLLGLFVPALLAAGPRPVRLISSGCAEGEVSSFRICTHKGTLPGALPWNAASLYPCLISGQGFQKPRFFSSTQWSPQARTKLQLWHGFCLTKIL